MITKWAIIAVMLLISPTGTALARPTDRGAYLVNAVMACDNCHTPRGATGLDMAQRFSGSTEIWDTPEYRVQGSNITPDRVTGIGGWSRQDLKRLLTTGVRPDGTRVAPQMPYGFYAILTPADLEAVVTYVRSVRPVRRAVPPPFYKRETVAAAFPGAAAARRSVMRGDTQFRGFYVATLAYCMACHSRRPDGVPDMRHWWGRGGFEMRGSYGNVVVPNITASRMYGVGTWTDAELARALITGVGRDGRPFRLPMARQAVYRQMSKGDLTAVIGWLRTIPPAR